MSTMTGAPSGSTEGGSRGTSATPWIAAAIFAGVALLLTGLHEERKVEFDGEFHLPVKPDEPYLTANNLGVVIVMTLVGLVGVALGIKHHLKHGSVLPLLVAISGAAICIPEVFFDVMGAVYFPWSDSEPLGHAYTILGREMPWWIVAGWFGYGVFLFATFELLLSRPTTRAIWGMFGVAVAGDVVFEEILLKFDVYHYYGNQPLILLWELPWWWVAANPAGVFLAAAIGYRYRERLQGARSLAMLVITPLSVSAVYGAVALPSWIAVNDDFPWLVRESLGLATLALGFVVFTLILRLVLGRAPFDMNYVPVEDLSTPRVSTAR